MYCNEMCTVIRLSLTTEVRSHWCNVEDVIRLTGKYGVDFKWKTGTAHHVPAAVAVVLEGLI